MCGIIGIIGQHEAAPIMVEALKRLEYRGYDSAGIATIQNGNLDRRRAVGKLIELQDTLVHSPLAGKIGIGHTRWATHGEPSLKNAHPHAHGTVALVHNGIIENFRELHSELENLGYKKESDTDTETVAIYTSHLISTGLEPIDAARQTVAKLEGAFALAFIFQGHDNLMVVARKGSPLAIGHGNNEMFVGSDAIALSPMTKKITYLEEGDFAVLSRTSLNIWDASGNDVTRDIHIISGDTVQYDKQGFSHFMEKEIHEQPSVLKNVISTYFGQSDSKITLPSNADNIFEGIDKITMVACGTAYYACFVAKYWFERLARIPVEIDFASEFRYREPPISKNTLALFVSQSGETADTLAALRYAKGKAKRVISIINVPTSTIARESDLALEIHAGTEIGVASTKAFSCQLVTLLSLTLDAAIKNDTISNHDLEAIFHDLRRLPALFNETLDNKSHFETIAHKLSTARDILFLGRGAMFPLAHEGALKLKEISYIHAEAYASGELKHGPIALIDDQVPVVVMAPQDALFDKSISNIQEVIARKGRVVLISNKNGIIESGTDVWHSIEMPKCHDIITPILYALPAQLLAYFTAIAKGTDVDQPRNLAKSVTVE